MKVVFIHPENHTYPIFSVELQNLRQSYLKTCDHEVVTVAVKNLQIFDNTSYPATLSPFTKYGKDACVVQTEIMGVKQSSST